MIDFLFLDTNFMILPLISVFPNINFLIILIFLHVLTILIMINYKIKKSCINTRCINVIKSRVFKTWNIMLDVLFSILFIMKNILIIHIISKFILLLLLLLLLLILLLRKLSSRIPFIPFSFQLNHNFKID